MTSVDPGSELFPPPEDIAREPIAAPVEGPAGKAQRKLESAAVRATIWTVMAYGTSQALRLANSFVLTRLLMPEYFGLMALMSTLVLGMTLLSDVGLQPSVTSSAEGDEPIFLNTAWTVQIVRGMILWLIALALTLPLASIYREPRIRMLLPVLALTLVLNGLASSNVLSVARHMGVRRILVLEFSAQLFAITVMIVWAELYPTVWALVGGNLAGATMRTTLSHIPGILPGQRNRLTWDKSSLRSLVHIGKWIILGTAFYFFASQADRLILGRLVTFSVLGVYSIAFTMADIPRQVIQQFGARVGFPFAAKMAHLPLPEFRQKVLSYRFYVLCAGALLLSVVVNAGGPVVLRLYDHRYEAAGWMVPILALGLWHTLLYSTTRDILLARKTPKYNTIGTAVFCATMFVALPLAFHYFGMRGAVISVAAGDFPLYVVLMIGAERQRVSMWRQDALATVVFVALVAAGFGIRHLAG